MDSALGLCIGCFRSLDEITTWSRTDDNTRAKILATVAQRRLEHPSCNDELRVTQNK
jgi:predicted Fe-S protein YdhL (DUF1289 family)